METKSLVTASASAGSFIVLAGSAALLLTVATGCGRNRTAPLEVAPPPHAVVPAPVAVAPMPREVVPEKPAEPEAPPFQWRFHFPQLNLDFGK